MEPVRIGDATLYLGDCLEILPTLGPVDAVVTDPPYGLNYPYESYEDTVDNLRKLICGFLPVARMIAKRVVTFSGLTNMFEWPRPDWVASWNWRGTNVYGKLCVNQWQPVLFYGKDLPGFGAVNGAIKSDAFYYEGGNCGEKKDFSVHTCPKNVGIMERLIVRFSLQRDEVLDPFMGSGTTGVACANLGRKFIGIEIEPKYFEIACKRIKQAYAQPRLFEERPKAVQLELGDG